MRILVCGGRRYRDRERVDAVLDRVHREKGITVLIHGYSKGADALAHEWACRHHVPIKGFAAEWDSSA